MSIFLLLFSIVLSASAQLLLKVGMEGVRPRLHTSAGLLETCWTIGTSPWVLGGLATYFASAAVWLLVLSRMDLSRAYPCVALGFALTAVGAHVFLGEAVSLWRGVGIGVVIAGVTIVAFN